MIDLTTSALSESLAPEEQYFSMAAITDGTCLDLDLPVSHYFQKMLMWGMRGLVELKMDTANCVKPVMLEISDVLTATLPADCVDVGVVAIPYGQYYKELSRTDDLNKMDRTAATFNPSKRNPPGWLPNGVDMQPYGLYQFANYGGRALYAIGGGLPHRGHYCIVQRQGCKEILLDAGLQIENNQLYVEYIGLGINQCNQDTIVGAELAEFVRCYQHHCYAKWGKGNNKSEAEIVRTGRELWHAEVVARGRTKAITPTDLLMISRKSYRMTNKA